MMNFTKRYFADRKIPVDVEFSWGATEAKAAEELKAAEARENAKKLARTKLLRERKQALLARLQQQREQGGNSLAFGYAEPFSDGAGLYSFAPRYR